MLRLFVSVSEPSLVPVAELPILRGTALETRVVIVLIIVQCIFAPRRVRFQAWSCSLPQGHERFKLPGKVSLLRNGSGIEAAGLRLQSPGRLEA